MLLKCILVILLYRLNHCFLEMLPVIDFKKAPLTKFLMVLFMFEKYLNFKRRLSRKKEIKKTKIFARKKVYLHRKLYYSSYVVGYATY